LLGLQYFLQSLANTHTPLLNPHLFHTHAMLPSIVRRVDRRGQVFLSDGWVARAPAPISPPLRPVRHSLEYNGLGNQAKKAVKDAAGSGVSITF